MKKRVMKVRVVEMIGGDGSGDTSGEFDGMVVRKWVMKVWCVELSLDTVN